MSFSDMNLHLLKVPVIFSGKIIVLINKAGACRNGYSEYPAFSSKMRELDKKEDNEPSGSPAPAITF